MAKLIATSALGGQAAITIAAATLAQMDIGPITSVAPFPNREAAVAKALGGFPAPNRFITAGAAQIVWSGRAQAFYIGAPCPDLGDSAAVTDQTGGWVTLSLTGAGGGGCFGALCADRSARDAPGRGCAQSALSYAAAVDPSGCTGLSHHDLSIHGAHRVA